MEGIVYELEREALDENVSVESLLRKAYLVARKLKLSDFEGKRSNPCTLTFKKPLTTVFLFSDVFWQLW